MNNSLASHLSNLLHSAFGAIGDPEAQAIPALLAGLLAVLYLHRHNVLSYGSERETALPEAALALFILAVPRVAGASIGSLLVPIIALILWVVSVSKALLSYALQRSPFVAFDAGLGLGVLTVYHPAFFLFAPFVLYKFSVLKLLSMKHFSAFIMAVVCAWWLSIVVFADMTVEGIAGFPLARLWLLLSPALPSPRAFVYLLGLLLLTITVTLKVYSVSPFSIARHKWVLSFQTGAAWLALIPAMIYSTSQVWLLVPSFFLCSMLRHLLSLESGRDTGIGWFFLTALAVGGVLIAWSAWGPVPAFLSSLLTV